MDSIVIEAPAKLNIRLKVVGRRRDGYHELVSVMVPVDLTDRLEIDVTGGGGIRLHCTGADLPSGESNLAHRAARAFLSEAELREGLSIRLHKRIPIAAGLGGGSSDAASVLLGLNSLWPGRLGPEELHRLAVQLGADVPFFLSAVPSVAAGIGEKISPLAQWPDLWYILVKPPFEVSTAWVYSQLKFELTTRENNCIFNTLFTNGDSVVRIMENDLERVTETRFPDIRSIKKALIAAGAQGALMSGSGPTVFGIFYDHNSARSAERALISHGLGDIFVATDWKQNRT